MADFDRAIAGQPQDSRARLGRAIAVRGAGDFGGALRDLQSLVALDPTYAPAYHERGAMLAAQNRLREAMADLDRSIDLEPSATALVDRGGALSKLGRLAEALADLRRAIEMEPALAAAHFNLGAVLATAGQVCDAVPPFRRALQLGLEQAGPALKRALQTCFVEAAEDGSAGLATEAVLDARSLEDLEDALERFPFVALPEFLDAVLSIEQTLPYPERQALRQRTRLLQRIARP